MGDKDWAEDGGLKGREPIRKRLTGGGLTKETDVREGRRDRGTGDLFHK